MSTAALPASLDRLVQKFARVRDPKQGYELLLFLAKTLPAIEDGDRIEANKVQGCVSQVFINAELRDGAVYYRGDSDSQLTKGLAALLIQGLSGLEPKAITDLEPDFIKQTKLNVSLTPSRANGFYNIFKMMQGRAAQFLEQ
ncbi:MAG: SufE family protein [Cyanobacteria bacterium P01_D01_bin.73]